MVVKRVRLDIFVLFLGEGVLGVDRWWLRQRFSYGKWGFGGKDWELSARWVMKLDAVARIDRVQDV